LDYDALERLVRLRDSGALTEHEFAEQKSLLVDPIYSSTMDTEEQRRRWPTPAVLTAVTMVALIGAAAAYFKGSDVVGLLDTRSPEERQCQASIKASLVNPETAEFFEFQTTSRERYLSKFEENLRAELTESVSVSGAGSGLSGMYAQGMAAATEGIISKHVREAVSSERSRLSGTGLAVFSYRIKANGKLGNVITSTQLCVVGDNRCDCL
jgi:hypothetical protein